MSRFRAAPRSTPVAKEWLLGRLLPTVQLSSERLVIIPGNHDVDRRQVSRAAHALHRDLLKTGRQEDIAQVVGDPRDRIVLLARHDAFVAFMNELNVGARIWDVPWGAVTMTVRGFRVHVAALCSSWLSSGDADKGSLLLGLRQVNEAFQGANSADLVLTAVHHPWSYMADFDRVSQSEVHRSSSIVLRGHLHQRGYLVFILHPPMKVSLVSLPALAMSRVTPRWRSTLWLSTRTIKVCGCIRGCGTGSGGSGSPISICFKESLVNSRLDMPILRIRTSSVNHLRLGAISPTAPELEQKISTCSAKNVLAPPRRLCSVSSANVDSNSKRLKTRAFLSIPFSGPAGNGALSIG